MPCFIEAFGSGFFLLKKARNLDKQASTSLPTIILKRKKCVEL
jgi:hypothetical protein